MTSERRRRQLAREKYERQQSRRTQAEHRRRTRQRIIAAVVVAALVVAGGAWVVLARMSGGAATAGDGASVPSIAPQPSVTQSDPASSIECSPPGSPRADDKAYPSAPTAPPGSAASVITLTTNCGPIAITTLPDKAPATVASEVFLAQDGFYDRTSCHRVTTAGIFVLQCGDPKGDGTGGPGYSVPDENLPAGDGVNYPAGTVAMANAGPGTAGSQFFIVYQDTTLPPGYTIWGKVTEGLDLVQRIAAAGAEGGTGDGRPVQPVFIESATVSPA